MKNKNIKRFAALVCAMAVVGLLAAMPLLAQQDQQEDGPQASILSGTVSAGSIDTKLIGGGTLAEDDGVSVSIPAAVKLTQFLVANGDAVTEGTALATVDRVTVMTAISQVQETLEYLSEQIEEASGTSDTENVTALAGGTVKILYAEEGDSVQSVMLDHGALAVLSLDGLMAVDLETASTLAAGAAVTVALSDGTEAAGKVAKNLAGAMTVTLEDDGYALDDIVQVTAEDGTSVGSGQLYIYSPWNATAYTGTVETVKVSVGDELSAGKTLMVLEDVGQSPAYRQLIGQRQAYEELMLELFEMYQTQAITAPCDGVVSGIDEDSVHLLSDDGEGFVLSFLANAPNGDDETLYLNYLAQVTSVSAEGWGLNIDPQAMEVADYLELTGASMDTASLTQAAMHTQMDLPIYTAVSGAWKQVLSSSIGVGDLLLFAADPEGELVWCVLIRKAQDTETPTEPEQPTQPSEPSEPTQPSEPTAPTEPDQPTEPTQPTDPTQPSEPTAPTEPTQPSDPTQPTEPTQPGGSGQPSQPQNPGSSGSIPSGGTGNFPSGDTGSFSSGGSWSGSTTAPQMGGTMEPEPEYELYGLDMAQIATVTGQSTMTLEIIVDELDIGQLQVGMEAQVKIDALGGEKYSAVITQIGNTGTNNGGSSKYTVELTMDRGENMLSGMNATASIVLSSASDVMTVPAAALVENGNQTLVYTGYDEENDVLLFPVAVTVGSSDGQTAQILEGLSLGQTYYYAYFDTLEVSFSPDFGGGGFMFG